MDPRGTKHNEPAVSVVGFRVQGATPSPEPPASILQDAGATMVSTSPTPVIIPPQFQREPGSGRATGATDAHRVLDFAAAPTAVAGPEGAPAAAAAAGPAASGGAAPKSEPRSSSGGGRPPLPGGGSGGGAAAASGAEATSPSAARAAAAGGKAAAGAAAPQQTAAQERGGQQKQQEQQQRGGPPDGVPPKKPTTRAERRAIQEASRAAKAARLAAEGKGGGGGGTSGGSGSGGAAGGGGGGNAAAAPPERPPSRAPSVAAGGSAGSTPHGSAGGATDGPAAAVEPRRSGGGGHAGGKHGKHGGGGASTELFAHLQQYRPVTVEGVLSQKDATGMHPAIVALALRYADGSISGGTQRCVALLHALAQLISDYKTPPGKSLPRDLLASVNAAVDFLVRCRPLGVGMGNAIKFLKLCISKIDPNAPEASAKTELLKQLGDFIQEKVVVADQVLAATAVGKIYDGDVVMTYSYSQVVLEVLLRAHAAGRRFRVVIVDSRPDCGGRQLLARLLDANMACTYTLLSGLSYIIKEVTKVVLGAAAVLSNGTVVSRAGSAAVAMTAAAAGKPVLVCCETLKFHERVQLDSITHNELGDPGALAKLPPGTQVSAPPSSSSSAATDPAHTPAAAPGDGPVPSPALAGWEAVPRLGLLNLRYDAMPAEYVTMVVTEFGMIPPSSVPVILREWGAKLEEGA